MERFPCLRGNPIVVMAIVAFITAFAPTFIIPAHAQQMRELPLTLEGSRIEVLDESFQDLIDPMAKVMVVADGFTWAEGPVWNKGDKRFQFSDVPNNKIYQIDKRQLSVFLTPSGYDGQSAEQEPGSNGLMYDATGQLIVCDHGNRRLYRLAADGKTKTTLVDKFEGKRFNSPNDLVIKSNGDIFFTDPPYGLKDETKRELDFCGVYCLKPNGEIALVTKELKRPNGIGLSPDEKTIYVAQSHRPNPVYMKYAINDDGSFGAGEVLYNSAEFAKDADANPGMPDGMAVDIHGNLWATGPGGVLVISPAGKLLGRIYTGTPTANCTFVGDGTSLMMTAGKRLLTVQTISRGLGGWRHEAENLLVPPEVVKEIQAVMNAISTNLDNKEFEKVLDIIVPASELSAAKTAGRYEGFVKKITRRSKRLSDAINSSAFTSANYISKFSAVVFEPSQLVFVKVDGQWRLHDGPPETLGQRRN